MFLHRNLQHSIYPESLHIQNCPTPDTVSVCWLWGLPNACHILFFTVKDFEINPDIRRVLKALGVAEFCNEFRDLLTKRERQTFESYLPSCFSQFGSCSGLWYHKSVLIYLLWARILIFKNQSLSFEGGNHRLCLLFVERDDSSSTEVSLKWKEFQYSFKRFLMENKQSLKYQRTHSLRRLPRIFQIPFIHISFL